MKRYAPYILIAILILVTVLSGCGGGNSGNHGGGPGRWELVGGSLNDSGTYIEKINTLAMSGTSVYVYWTEQRYLNGYQRFVFILKRFNGTSWEQVGDISSKPATSAGVLIAAGSSLAIRDLDGTQFVGIVEDLGYGVCIMYYDGTQWNYIDSPTRRFGEYSEPMNPQLLFSDKMLYMNCWEYSKKSCKIVNVDTSTINQTTPVDVGNNTGTPTIMAASGDSSLYVTWAGDSVYVKHLTGSSLTPVGGGVNVDLGNRGRDPAIACMGTTPYVAWLEELNTPGIYQIFVKHFDGSVWVQDGGALNVDPSASARWPSIAIYGTTPYVAWAENKTDGSQQIFVKHFNGSAWVQDGGSLNVNPANMGVYPKIAFNGSTPYVLWYEGTGMYGLNGNIYVKRWVK